jgi:predicted SAM-dependent methyltransferase
MISEYNKINLGCNDTRIEGFNNIDIRESENVDLICDASDLSMFKDGQLEEIYASNILEHFSHTLTDKILKDWCRTLKKYGTLWISVPDLDHIISSYNKLNYLAPWFINIIYGDQTYNEAYHYTIFNWPTLQNKLYAVGFEKVYKIPVLPYFKNDCSNNRNTMTKELISINVKAVK